MKVLFTIGRYWPAIGGAELLARQIATRLADSHEVAVAALVNGNDPDFLGGLRRKEQTLYQDGRVAVHLLKPSPIGRSFLEGYIQLACRNRMHSLQQTFFSAAYTAQLGHLVKWADLVHSLPAMSLSLVKLTLAVAQANKIPFVITPHLHAPEHIAPLREVFSRANGIIALTPVEKEWIAAAGIDSSKIEVIGLGRSGKETVTGPGQFRARYGLQGPMILFLGRKETYKGYHQILQAMPQIWRESPDANFVFIGPPTPQSEEDFAPWKNEPRVLEPGGISDAEKAEALADCDLLCVPSTAESFGQVYLEAWAAGKPVIAADIPVERAIIEPGEDGLLTAQEPAAVAEAILFLLKHPEEAAAMGARGKIKVQQEYNWEIIFNRTLAFYERLTKTERLVQCPSAAS